MGLPSAFEAAKGAFACPAILKMRAMADVPLNNDERRRQAYAAVIELRAFLDAQFHSSMFSTLLSMARLRDKSLPNHSDWMAGWDKIKHRMSHDGKFVAALCDRLPGVLAKYNVTNGIQIFGDPVIHELAKWGMK